MILCSLLDRFNVTLHMNDLQKKYGNMNMIDINAQYINLVSVTDGEN